MHIGVVMLLECLDLFASYASCVYIAWVKTIKVFYLRVTPGKNQGHNMIRLVILTTGWTYQAKTSYLYSSISKIDFNFQPGMSKCSLSFVENFSRLQKQLHIKWKQFQNPQKKEWFWLFSKPILTFKSFAKAIWKPTFFQKVLWTRLRKTKALFSPYFWKGL